MSSLEFFKIVTDIDKNTSVEFRSKAYKWMDEKHNNMFTVAAKELEEAIDVLLPVGRNDDLVLEGKRYHSTIWRGFKMYMNEVGMSEVEVMMDANKEQVGL